VRYSDIKKATRASPYRIDMEWRNLERTISDSDPPVDMDPEYQRGYVWTTNQAAKYVEHVLSEGIGGRDVYLNCPGWPDNKPGIKCEVVDGKQRITAVRRFMKGDLRIFGGKLITDFRGPMRGTVARFFWHINDLETPQEVMRWYLEMNGGTAHTDQELNRVKESLANIKSKK